MRRSNDDDWRCNPDLTVGGQQSISTVGIAMAITDSCSALRCRHDRRCVEQHPPMGAETLGKGPEGANE